MFSVGDSSPQFLRESSHASLLQLLISAFQKFVSMRSLLSVIGALSQHVAGWLWYQERTPTHCLCQRMHSFNVTSGAGRSIKS